MYLAHHRMIRWHKSRSHLFAWAKSPAFWVLFHCVSDRFIQKVEDSKLRNTLGNNRA